MDPGFQEETGMKMKRKINSTEEENTGPNTTTNVNTTSNTTYVLLLHQCEY
jgi:hypothetical protein